MRLGSLGAQAPVELGRLPVRRVPRRRVVQAQAAAERKATIAFKLRKYVTDWGQTVVLVGSAPELGTWDVNKGLYMSWHEGHTWAKTVTLAIPEGPASAAGAISYKYAIVTLDDGRIKSIQWQEGKNYNIHVPSQHKQVYLSVVDSWGGETDVTTEKAPSVDEEPAAQPATAEGPNDTDTEAAATTATANDPTLDAPTPETAPPAEAAAHADGLGDGVPTTQPAPEPELCQPAAPADQASTAGAAAAVPQLPQLLETSQSLQAATGAPQQAGAAAACAPAHAEGTNGSLPAPAAARQSATAGPMAVVAQAEPAPTTPRRAGVANAVAAATQAAAVQAGRGPPSPPKPKPLPNALLIARPSDEQLQRDWVVRPLQVVRPEERYNAAKGGGGMPRLRLRPPPEEPEEGEQDEEVDDFGVAVAQPGHGDGAAEWGDPSRASLDRYGVPVERPAPDSHSPEVTKELDKALGRTRRGAALESGEGANL